MTATMRSASSTPASISFASSPASDTLCSGTLRTSIGSGTGLPPWLAGTGSWDDGSAGRPGQGIGNVVQRRNDRPATVLGEPAGSLDLRSHAAGREMPVAGECAHPGNRDFADRAGLGGAPALNRGRDVRGDDQCVGI